MHVVIFSGGILVASSLVTEVIASADMILAADSGANTAIEFGVCPSVVLGDMDSIDARTNTELKKQNVKSVVSPSEKDETDTELAIDFAIKKGATEITMLGGTYGERIDHILANVLLITLYKVPIVFVNGLQKSFFLKGPFQTSLKGQKNDLLSLIPLAGDVTGLTTSGLQWELINDRLAFGKPRGISNVFLKKEITLSLKKGILFVSHIAVRG